MLPIRMMPKLRHELLLLKVVVLLLLGLLPTSLSWIIHQQQQQQQQRTPVLLNGLPHDTRFGNNECNFNGRPNCWNYNNNYNNNHFNTIGYQRQYPNNKLPNSRLVPSSSLFVSGTTIPNDDSIVSLTSIDDSNNRRSDDGRTIATLTTNDSSITGNINIPLLELAIAGSITTFFADICMHPMDTIKTTLQSDVGIGWNIVQAFDHIMATGGLAAFYSGFLTYAFSDALGGAFKFTVWEFWKQSIMNQIQSSIFPPQQQQDQSTTTSITNEQQSDTTSITIQEKVLHTSLLWVGAALAFLASSVVIVPGELIKQQLQMGHYATLLDAVQGILSTQGIHGFYIGYEGVLYRDVPYTMIELGLYEMLKKSIDQYKYNQYQIELEKEKMNPTTMESTTNDELTSTPSLTTSWYEEIGAAAVTGAMSSFCTTPLDTIKTKLMVDQALYPDSSFWDCFYQTIDQHGFGAIFAGVSARMGWIIPFTILYLPTYDYLRRQLEKYHSTNQLLLQQQQTEVFQQEGDKDDEVSSNVSTDPLTVSTAAVMIASSPSSPIVSSASSSASLFSNVTTTASMLTNATSSLNLL